MYGRTLQVIGTEKRFKLYYYYESGYANIWVYYPVF